MFWVSYSLAGLLESVFEISAVTVGTITVVRLWMRPVGGLLAGFIEVISTSYASSVF